MKKKNPENTYPEMGGQPPVKRKKGKKRIVLCVSLVAVLLVAAFVALPLWNLFGRAPAEDPANFYTRIPAENPEVTFDEDSGVLFVNNELIVMTEVGVTTEQMETLAAEYDAQVADAMEDIGFYQLRFDKGMTKEELERVEKKLMKEELVTKVFLNTALEVGDDAVAAEEEEFVKKDAVYPTDDWGGAKWNMKVPRGYNWGMEAIHAPAAWGYLSDLTEVKVGVIDSMVNTDHEDVDAETYVAKPGGVVNAITTGEVKPSDHGTHVSGIIGAEWNTVGVSGVMGDKGDLYYCYGNLSGSYYTPYEYLRTIKALVDKGVRAINISQNTSRLIGFAASRGNAKALNHLQTSADSLESGLKRLVEQAEAGERSDFVICVAAGNSNDTTYYKTNLNEYGYRDYELWPWEYFTGGESGGSLAKYNNFINLIDDEAVKDRIIVVGSAGVSSANSTDTETRYHYSTFSNVGDRVDIVAPGEYVYSAVVNGYKTLSGTSMATPHVTGAAGLLFAANPGLTGPEVKELLVASTYGRFYYEGGYSGMLDLETAVINALQTETKPVSTIINSQKNNGLDICFVVDTTGSMEDDIDNAKQNMSNILAQLSEKSANYRVALIDYRDFADRSDHSQDYPAKVQLPFTSNTALITDAINSLSLGHGGDEPETVYSALMEAVRLNWDEGSQKVVIVLGDAPPLDPEPNTGYTLQIVLDALYHADLAINMEESDDRVLGDAKYSAITVYSIGTDASDSAEEYFTQIAEQTGGTYTGVSDASGVSDAIIDSIEQIDITPVANLTVAFGEDYPGETVEIYQDGEFRFEIQTTADGSAKLDGMEFGDYEWKIKRLGMSGAFEVEEGGRYTEATHKAEWYTFALTIWYQHRVPLIGGAVAVLVVLILLLVVIHQIKKHLRKKKAAKVRAAEPAQTPPPVNPPAPTAPVADPAPPVPAAEEPAPTPAEQTSVCPACGAVYTGEQTFCTRCGARMKS